MSLKIQLDVSERPLGSLHTLKVPFTVLFLLLYPLGNYPKIIDYKLNIKYRPLIVFYRLIVESWISYFLKTIIFSSHYDFDLFGGLFDEVRPVLFLDK